MDGEQEYGVPDAENPEWTDEDFKNAKLFAEVFPDIALAIEKEWPPRWVQEAWEPARAADAVDPSAQRRESGPRAINDYMVVVCEDPYTVMFTKTGYWDVEANTFTPGL